MSNDLTPPAVPEDELDAAGWKLANERTETLFEVPAARIRGATRRYEDEQSRIALREATADAIDHPIRFFAVTQLGFEPSLPPGVSPALFGSTLRSEVRKAFVDRLEERGLVDIERAGSERIRLPDRSRARIRTFTATDPLLAYDNRQLRLECSVAVWIKSGTVRIATGGYPAVSLATQFDLDIESGPLTRSPDAYRDSFLDLLRGVGQNN